MPALPADQIMGAVDFVPTSAYSTIPPSWDGLTGALAGSPSSQLAIGLPPSLITGSSPNPPTQLPAAFEDRYFVDEYFLHADVFDDIVAVCWLSNAAANPKKFLVGIQKAARGNLGTDTGWTITTIKTAFSYNCNTGIFFLPSGWLCVTLDQDIGDGNGIQPTIQISKDFGATFGAAVAWPFKNSAILDVIHAYETVFPIRVAAMFQDNQYGTHQFVGYSPRLLRMADSTGVNWIEEIPWPFTTSPSPDAGPSSAKELSGYYDGQGIGLFLNNPYYYGAAGNTRRRFTLNSMDWSAATNNSLRDKTSSNYLADLYGGNKCLLKSNDFYIAGFDGALNYMYQKRDVFRGGPTGTAFFCDRTSAFPSTAGWNDRGFGFVMVPLGNIIYAVGVVDETIHTHYSIDGGVTWV